VLDNTTPPTLRSAEQVLSDMAEITVWLNRKGQRVRPDCEHIAQENVQLWPAVLEPWLPQQEWQENRLPAMSTECPIHASQSQNQLLISGVNNGSVIRRPEKKAVVVTVKASGGTGLNYWFKDRVLSGTTQNNQSIKMEFSQEGDHSISVINDAGSFKKVIFFLD